MFLSNCHTHTIYCDGKNTVEEMINSAIDVGFVSLGFSGHSPLKRVNNWEMTTENINFYVDEVKKMKIKYKNKIDILCGIELDSDYADIDLSCFDYIIGSVHQFFLGDKSYPIDLSEESFINTIDEVFLGDKTKMYKSYYKALADFIKKVKPDIVGHFDLITKFNLNNNIFNEDDSEYIKTALEAVDSILESKQDIIFEINTGAMYRVGKERPYPAPFIMKYLSMKKANITITSDSHCCESINFAFEKAVEYCKSFGFEKIIYLTSNGNRSIKV